MLNDGYLRLHEVSREKNAGGRSAYEAIVMLGGNRRTDECSCLWLDTTSADGLDNNGMGRGKPTGNSVTFRFFAGTPSSFRAVFKYDHIAGSWQWDMDADANGKLQPFARMVLTRQAKAA